MKTKTSSLLLVLSLVWLATHHAAAATIPAGTDLIVRTMDAVQLTDHPGRKFGMTLVQPVSAGGKVVLPAGTKLTGRVATSQRLMSSSDRLTVDLHDLIVGGHAVPIKTAGAVPLEQYTSSRGVSVSRGAYTVAAGRTLKFRLAKPINV